MKTIQQALERYFGYKDFRPFQKEIILSSLQSKDSLAVLPTGGGKSLCYQVPPLMQDGMTVVISPLISLMRDQVNQLTAKGIEAAALNSSIDPIEYHDCVYKLKKEKIKLLYLAPETALKQKTIALLKDCNVTSIAIDEAHCISQWGHDFRPEYRELKDLRNHFPKAVVTAFTATATPQVRKDICGSLKIPVENQFIASFDRKNLFITVKEKSDTPYTQVLQLIKHRQGLCGIVYCFSRRIVDELSDFLKKRGVAAAGYHAGIPERLKRKYQDDFVSGDIQVIVATIAFGMGVHKPNIRYVIHHDMPKNIESYYQEIGRAGRDGEHADCILLYSYKDRRKIQYFISQKKGKQRENAEKHLEDLIRFLEADDCRRAVLLGYFGERYSGSNCGMCDICTDSVERKELNAESAVKFLLCMKETGQVFGAGHISEVLSGGSSDKVLQRGHNNLSIYGAGREKTQRAWMGFAKDLLRNNLIRRNQHGGLVITQEGMKLLRNKPKPAAKKQKTVLIKSEKKREGGEIEIDLSLLEALKTKRKELAQEKKVPAFVVFHDSVLEEIALRKPAGPGDLLAIKGIGKKKLDLYGEPFLKLVREYA
ncbi:MAG: DNA helicase RecQ [Spirochaetia bacterium]